MASCEQELLLRPALTHLMQFNASQLCYSFQKTNFPLVMSPSPSLSSSSSTTTTISTPSPPLTTTTHKENRALKVSPKRNKPAKLSIPDHARLASFHKANQFRLIDDSSSSSRPDLCHPCGPNDLFGLASKKGRKFVMEDGYLALPNFKGQPKQGLFSVFDGHGGIDAVKFVAEKLGENIAMAMDSESNIDDAMVAGYANTDSQFLAKDVKSGACSVSALVTEGQLVVANAGDCKAVLCRGGKAEALTTLHRANNKEERQRIEDLGGFIDCINGMWRLQGTLAVTRGFGDKNLKRWVSSKPDVKKIKITPECEFVILASDGLWDKVSDQEAIDCAREVLLASNVSTMQGQGSSTRQHKDGDLKMNACNMLIQKASSRGNIDDIIVMIVPLQSFSYRVEAKS